MEQEEEGGVDDASFANGLALINLKLGSCVLSVDGLELGMVGRKVLGRCVNRVGQGLISPIKNLRNFKPSTSRNSPFYFVSTLLNKTDVSTSHWSILLSVLLANPCECEVEIAYKSDS